MIIPETLEQDIELLAIPHLYSCGGYWLTKCIGDEEEYWRISPSFGQGAVMSESQIEEARKIIQSRQKGNVTVSFIPCLPHGAKVMNARK